MLKRLSRLFASLASLLLVNTAKAQDQSGCITFWNEDDDFVALRIEILQNDSLVKTDVVYRTSSALVTDTLPAGKYNLRVYRDEELALTIHNIRIEAGRTLTQTITFPESYYKPAVINNYDSARTEVSLVPGYAPKLLETDPGYPITGTYSLGLITGQYFSFTKNYALGFLYGTTATLATFDRHKPLRPYLSYSDERYFYWDANFGISNRFTAFNFMNEDAKGVFIDLFAYYNLPLMFRHTVVNGDHKMIDHRIHQFTDFSVGARVGYYPFALQAEYRLTDYLIAGYPEMPQLRFGLIFFLQAN